MLLPSWKEPSRRGQNALGQVLMRPRRRKRKQPKEWCQQACPPQGQLEYLYQLQLPLVLLFSKHPLGCVENTEIIILNMKYNLNYSSLALKRYVLCPVVTISPSLSLKMKSSLRLQGMLYRDSRSRQTLLWRFLLRRNKTKILRFWICVRQNFVLKSTISNQEK